MTDDSDPSFRRAESLDEELLEAESADVESYLDDETRVDRVVEELRMGFSALAHIGKAVSSFGSARTPRDHPEDMRARRAARLLGRRASRSSPGAGPGDGGRQPRRPRAGVPSMGLDMELPQGAGDERVRRPGPHLPYFFTRKVIFVRYASAYVALPGRFGTLDELFEASTLRQTRKIRGFPIVLLKSSYRQGFLD